MSVQRSDRTLSEPSASQVSEAVALSPPAAVVVPAPAAVVVPPPEAALESPPAAAKISPPEAGTDRHARALIARIRKNWNDVAAIRSLAEHYGKSADYASLANLMEGWGDALEEPRAAANAYVEAADALLLANRPSTEARILYERALTRDASHVQALDRLTRVLEEAKNYDRLKQVLKYVAHQLQQQSSSPQLLATVHYRLGQVYENHFDERRKAATLYRQAIEENPRLISAISAARRLYLDQGNLKTVSLLFELEIEATPNSDDKHALLLALARHKREACDDLDGAVLAFRRAAKLIPTSVRALFGLAETLLARGENVETPAGAADRKRAAEVFFHLAQRVSGTEAVPYLQRALLVAPGHAQARAMLENVSRKTGSGSIAPPAASRSSEPTSAEAWLNESDLVPLPEERSQGRIQPIELDSSAESGGRPRVPGRPSSQPPPPALQTVPPRPSPKPQPPAAPPRRAPAPAPAAALPQQSYPSHPKVVAALPDEPGRRPLEVNVGSASDSNFYVDASDELFEGGVFIATYSPLCVGTRCSMTITLPGKVIVRAHGRVVLTRDLADAFENHIPGMCVAFERLDPKSAALIERFARKRLPTFIEF